MLKKFLAGAAIAASMLAMSTAATAGYLTNWYIDPDGTGTNASQTLVQSYLGLNGEAYVNNSISGSNVSFNEVGSFNTFGSGQSNNFGAYALSSYFVGTGTGTLGGALSFATGELTVKASDGTVIGIFDLVSGSGALYANSTLPNGTISLIFKASTLADGYFFDSSNNDLADIVKSADGLLFGFATTNAINLAEGAPNTKVSSNLIAQFNEAFDTTKSNVTANDSTDLYISNNGQFRLEVPEPSMLSLLGLALLGAGFTTRRKSKV